MKISLNPFLQNGKDGLSQNEPIRIPQPSAFERTKNSVFLAGPLSRSLMKINLITLLLGLGLSQVDASTYAQQITLKRQKVSLETVLKDFENQSGYTFFYKRTDIASVRGINIDVKDMPLEQALNHILSKANFTFEYFDKTIVIKKKTGGNSPSNLVAINSPSVSKVGIAQQQVIRGKVLDENGQPIKGASIREKNEPNRAVVSQEDGSFTMPIISLNKTIVISYLGYETVETQAVLNPGGIVIRLKRKDHEVEEVVVTGMMERQRETFTGSSTRYSMEELKAVGNTNIIQSLKTLDPSFLLMENNLAGSNPNTLATIELRGTTSITTDGLRDEFSEDPNQPLFILDGFPSTLRVITDLDINRIASVTLLKDAASTAMYGSRASNGVVVVETVRPKANEISLNYTTDMNLDFADLRSYNMMNSTEKLEFERLSGRYIAHPRFGTPISQMDLDSLYSQRLMQVLSGVDSYWLNEPVRNAFSQRHSLMVSGGEGALSYGLGGDYKYQNGIMKGSDRDTWGARLNIAYRGKKLNLSNQLYVNGFSSEESPYGNFSNWVDVNPYFKKLPSTEPYLEILRNPYAPSQTLYVNNPFYTASIGNFDKSNSFQLTNNTSARYDINNNWRVESTLQINKNGTHTQNFKSPLDQSFRQSSFLQKGSLRELNRDEINYTVNGSLTYSNVFNEKHILNGFLRAEAYSKVAESDGYSLVGFPSQSTGNPRFAYGYLQNSRPNTSKVVNRRNSLISTLNYSFDRRYNLDLTYSLDGTTSFGNENLYAPFYAVGASWNLHQEPFFKNALPSVEMLRLRANFGRTGNQNFTSYTSASTYGYIKDFNVFGQGVNLLSLGNTGLEWQKTDQTSLGIDFGLANGRFRGYIEAYRKLTDPLVIAVALPPSTALSNYPMNAGTLTVDGIDLSLTYFPIYKPQDRILWSIRFTGGSNTQIYDKFNKILEGLNNELRQSKSLIKYRDGGDASDIWAVRSLGIDPATGMEIFKKKDGSYSYQYDYLDEEVVGNSRPAMQGVISTNLTYKAFTASVAMRYIYNQDVFNSALFNKVENISMEDLINSNQDRRALYDRWQNPGDHSEFRRILLTDFNQIEPGFLTSGSDVTPMSSRFVQRENRLTIESVNLSYDLRQAKWMDKYRLSNLRLTAYMNDIAYWSTVKRERGIDYPYARSVSFSISANFR